MVDDNDLRPLYSPGGSGQSSVVPGATQHSGRGRSPGKMDYVIRKATIDDRLAIEQLIIESARKLSRDDYSDEQIEEAIRAVFGVDTKLIEDGTYFVAVASGKLIGSGGWSKRRTLFGGDQFAERDSAELDQKSEAARIRAFFVHPKFARRGIGRAILMRCEAEARAVGFGKLELMSTLPGIRLYEACGYQEGEDFAYPMANGVVLPLRVMRKQLLREDNRNPGPVA